VNLIQSDILRIRAAEQRVLKESGLAGLLETKRCLVQPVGWCALRIFSVQEEGKVRSTFTFSVHLLVIYHIMWPKQNTYRLENFSASGM
jgi:hypothetical protein